jgi:hypothetical protein
MISAGEGSSKWYSPFFLSARKAVEPNEPDTGDSHTILSLVLGHSKISNLYVPERAQVDK